MSHGATSDVRAWWPACPDYSPGETASPDAARYIPDDARREGGRGAAEEGTL